MDCLFAYTGRPICRISVNAATGAVNGLQNNVKRWYDAITGGWLSQDPMRVRGGRREPVSVLWEQSAGQD